MISPDMILDLQSMAANIFHKNATASAYSDASLMDVRQPHELKDFWWSAITTNTRKAPKRPAAPTAFR
jgi:hypothetical protein